MRILLLIFMIGVGVTGCSQSEESKDEMDSIARTRVAKENIQKSLKDPKSAEFKDVYVTKTGDRKTVCGYVNAKNSLGGYTGYERFFSTGRLTALESQGFRDFNEIWDSFCIK